MNIYDNNKTGQIFIIGALILAVILVSLAFSLNMVIYSENTAARGSAVSEETTLNHYKTLNRELNRTLNEYTEQKYMNRSNIKSSGKSAIDIIIRTEKRRQSHRAGLASIQTNPHYGILIGQDDFNRNYTSVSGDQDWQLVSNYSTIHKFEQKINPAKLKSISLSDLSSNPISNLNVYTVRFTNSSGVTKNVYIYYLSNNTNYRVQVNSNPPCIINGSASTININYNSGIINGKECSSLDFLHSSDWSISYHNSGNGGGTFGLALTGTESDITTSNFADPTTSPNANPFYQHIISYIKYVTRFEDSKQSAVLSDKVVVDIPGDLK